MLQQQSVFFSEVDNPVRSVTLNLYDLWSGNTELTKRRSKDEQLSKHFFFLFPYSCNKAIRVLVVVLWRENIVVRRNEDIHGRRRRKRKEKTKFAKPLTRRANEVEIRTYQDFQSGRNSRKSDDAICTFGLIIEQLLCQFLEEAE